MIVTRVREQHRTGLLCCFQFMMWIEAKDFGLVLIPNQTNQMVVTILGNIIANLFKSIGCFLIKSDYSRFETNFFLEFLKKFIIFY